MILYLVSVNQAGMVSFTTRQVCKMTSIRTNQLRIFPLYIEGGEKCPKK